MPFLHVLTEEPSMKIVLDELLSKLLPADVYFRVYPHQGKQDLERALHSTVPTLSRTPGSSVLIVRDQDRHDCRTLKQGLVGMIAGSRQIITGINSFSEMWTALAIRFRLCYNTSLNTKGNAIYPS